MSKTDHSLPGVGGTVMRVLIISSRINLPAALEDYFSEKNIFTIKHVNPFIALTHLRPVQPDYVILFRENMSSVTFNAFIDNYWPYDKTLSRLIIVDENKETHPSVITGNVIIPFHNINTFVRQLDRVLFANKNIPVKPENTAVVSPWHAFNENETQSNNTELLLLKVYINIQSIRINTLTGSRRNLLYSVDALFGILAEQMNRNLLWFCISVLDQFIDSIESICGCRVCENRSINDMLSDISTLSSIYKNILTEASDTMSRKNNLVSKRISFVIQYIDHNYTNPLSLGNTAEVFHISAPYLSRTFKNEMHMNFVTYLNKTRIDVACLLLLFSTYSIERISEKVGFTDSKYFIRVFKAAIGCTPKEYCMKHRSTDIDGFV